MNQRLKFFINSLKERRIVVSDAEFARLTGKQRSYVSEIISGKRSLSEQYVLKIADSFKELNKDWLLTGNGPMLNKDKVIVTTTKSSGDLDLYKKLIASLEETVASQKMIIQKLTDEIANLQKNNIPVSATPKSAMESLIIARAEAKILKKRARAANATPPDPENA